MKTITAGETIKVKIVAKDDQSGMNKVCVEASNLKDLPSSPSFKLETEMIWPKDSCNCTVELVIPEYIPDTKWSINSISLTNGAGRTKKFSSNKDFPAILFKVQTKFGIDVTPAELIGVSLEE